LVLVGATGKSAQIPLYVWLPDAMAGPTPVSALIHAATMVTAGVYVIARMHFVFEQSPPTLLAVAVVGSLTALFAATIGIAQRDMKKVLAYSTVSQLGFMFAGVGSYLGGTGTSNYQGGIFHLVTHAFFKAGLFLGAGSVMHALGGEGDVMKMGGLKKWLPHTSRTFLIYCLSIAGIFIGGFFSKDSILGGIHHAHWPVGDHPFVFHGMHVEEWFADHTGLMLYYVLLAAAGCTAFYMFRLYFLVFEGEYRGAEGAGNGHGQNILGAEHGHHDDDHGHGHGHGGVPHESPPAMTVVLWILAIGSVVVGFLGIPEEAIPRASNFFGEWLSPVLTPLGLHEDRGEFWTGAGIALVVSGCGIGLAYLLYGHGVSQRVKNFVAAFPRLYELVFNKYYIDEIYHRLFVRPTRWIAYALWKAVDTFFIDLVLVNGSAFIVGAFGKVSRYLQNGDLQRYIVGLLVGGGAVVALATHVDVWTGAKFDTQVSGREVSAKAHGAGSSAKRLQYRVDWDDGHGFGEPQPSPNFSHSYDAPGQKTIAVEAIDPRWNTVSRETHTVTVK
jgi:NADH-quinone oxidoreductase subunit L